MSAVERPPKSALSGSPKKKVKAKPKPKSAMNELSEKVVQLLLTMSLDDLEEKISQRKLKKKAKAKKNDFDYDNKNIFASPGSDDAKEFQQAKSDAGKKKKTTKAADKGVSGRPTPERMRLGPAATAPPPHLLDHSVVGPGSHFPMSTSVERVSADRPTAPLRGTKQGTTPTAPADNVSAASEAPARRVSKSSTTDGSVGQAAVDNTKDRSSSVKRGSAPSAPPASGPTSSSAATPSAPPASESASRRSSAAPPSAPPASEPASKRNSATTTSDPTARRSSGKPASNPNSTAESSPTLSETNGTVEASNIPPPRKSSGTTKEIELVRDQSSVSNQDTESAPRKSSGTGKSDPPEPVKRKSNHATESTERKSNERKSNERKSNERKSADGKSTERKSGSDTVQQMKAAAAAAELELTKELPSDSISEGSPSKSETINLASSTVIKSGAGTRKSPPLPSTKSNTKAAKKAMKKLSASQESDTNSKVTAAPSTGASPADQPGSSDPAPDADDDPILRHIMESLDNPEAMYDLLDNPLYVERLEQLILSTPDEPSNVPMAGGKPIFRGMTKRRMQNAAQVMWGRLSRISEGENEDFDSDSISSTGGLSVDDDSSSGSDSDSDSDTDAAAKSPKKEKKGASGTGKSSGGLKIKGNLRLRMVSSWIHKKHAKALKSAAKERKGAQEEKTSPQLPSIEEDDVYSDIDEEEAAALFKSLSLRSDELTSATKVPKVKKVKTWLRRRYTGAKQEELQRKALAKIQKQIKKRKQEMAAEATSAGMRPGSKALATLSSLRGPAAAVRATVTPPTVARVPTVPTTSVRVASTPPTVARVPTISATSAKVASTPPTSATVTSTAPVSSARVPSIPIASVRVASTPPTSARINSTPPTSARATNTPPVSVRVSNTTSGSSRIASIPSVGARSSSPATTTRPGVSGVSGLKLLNSKMPIVISAQPKTPPRFAPKHGRKVVNISLTK